VIEGIERDGCIQVHNAVLAYMRSLDMWGNSGKVDVVLPYAWPSGSAEVAGQPREPQVSGLVDPCWRFSINLSGAPALSLPEFMSYEQELIGGSCKAALVGLLTLGLALPVCAQEQDPVPPAESLEHAFPARPYSPYAARALPSRVYWGDTHLHTSYSFIPSTPGRLAPGSGRPMPTALRAGRRSSLLPASA
jgi:hypothetical protein